MKKVGLKEDKGNSKKIKELKNEQKRIFTKRNEIYKKNNFNKYGFHKLMKDVYKDYNMNIDSETAVYLAENCWKAWESVLFGKGERTWYKRKGEIESLAGTTNNSGMRCLLDENTNEWYLSWNTKKTSAKKNTNKLLMALQFKDDIYDSVSMLYDVVYPIITRKVGKSKDYDYYVNIILKGSSPKNIDKDTGEFKTRMGDGKVSVYIGIYTVSCFDGKEFYNFDLCKRNNSIESKISIIDKKMENIRRVNNPQNFNENGTIKKQGNKKVKWHYTEEYFKLKKKRKYLFRKQNSYKKQSYIDIVNSILSLGSDFVLNEVNSKFSQQEKGDVIKSSAPSLLMEMLKQNIDFEGGSFREVKTSKMDYKHYDLMENKFGEDFVYSYSFNNTSWTYTEYFSYLLYFFEEDKFNREDCVNSLDIAIKSNTIDSYTKENLLDNSLTLDEEVKKINVLSKKGSNRYGIYKKDDDKIINDAQGFGFKSMQKAKNFKTKTKRRV